MSDLGDYFEGGEKPFAEGVPVGPGSAGRDDLDDGTMTRSEEQLHVSTVTEAAGRVRLHKFVVTENVTTTVAVSREVVRLEREPVSESDRQTLAPREGLIEDDYELVLYAERVVVTKEIVPVERIRVERRVVTEDQQVNETVRKEQIEAETTPLS